MGKKKKPSTPELGLAESTETANQFGVQRHVVDGLESLNLERVPIFKVGDKVWISSGTHLTIQQPAEATEAAAAAEAANRPAALVYAEYVQVRQLMAARRRAQPSLQRLRRAVDWFPSPRTRKVLTKLVADQEALVQELLAAERTRAARWQVWVTWVLIVYSGMLHLIASVMSALRGKQRTN